MPPAGAQASRVGAQASIAQAERDAVDLKQGMTLEEVEKLLGKPEAHGAQKRRQLRRGQHRERTLARHIAVVDLRLGPGTHLARAVRRQNSRSSGT